MHSHARHNVKVIKVTQYRSDFDALLRRRQKNAAFEEWRLRLNRKDRLPRGPFFRGKTAGEDKKIMTDEFWRTSSPLPDIAW
jgi:hypothetical protein